MGPFFQIEFLARAIEQKKCGVTEGNGVLPLLSPTQPLPLSLAEVTAVAAAAAIATQMALASATIVAPPLPNAHRYSPAVSDAAATVAIG